MPAVMVNFSSPRDQEKRWEIVEALRQQNWVTTEDGVRLGPGLLALLPPDENSVLDLIHTHAESLWLKSGETVTTGRLIGREIFFMKKWISPQELRFVPVRSGGLPVMTPASIEAMPDFLNEMALVRKRGYAVDNEEYVQGISSFSVAIPVTARFSLAITLSSPTSRFNTRREELREMLLTLRDTIASSTPFQE